MANPDEELTVAQRLGRALDRGLLPAGGPAEAAERLIERLERPARIALLGLPGSGKSSILNLLVGSSVVPETLRLPTIIVQHGQTARMICTLTDGSTKILPGSDLAEVLTLAPALVTLEMDLAALKVISLLEVSAGPIEAEQKRAVSWASKRADIVIWCTTSYLPKEQVVWESLPDAVKDNSFMFLTKVDLLGSRQSASAMHDRVELRAGEEFRQILSISARQARAAMPSGGPVNREQFRDSGAGAVIAAIKTRVQSGRRADMDTAELLLARHVEASELVARRFAEPGEVTEVAPAWAPPPEPEVPAAVEIEDDVAEAAASDLDEETTEAEEWDEAEPEPEDAEAAPEEVAEQAATEEVGEVQPEPEELAALPEPEPPPASRKRFADRIKRVAADGDPGASPMIPLRSTWKSKSGPEPTPEPEPPMRVQETVRRPRATTQPAPDEDNVARMRANVTSAPDEGTDPPTDAAYDAASDTATDRAPTRPTAPRDRPARASTPRPEAAAESPEAEAAQEDRPKLFGAARGTAPGMVRGSPLPDLSSLRARPEEMTEAEEGIDPDDAEADDQAEAPASESAGRNGSPPEPEVEAEPELPPEAVSEPEVVEVPKPAMPPERPRLFNREPRVQPTEPSPPPTAQPQPRVTPISRMPASARMAGPAAQPAASATSTADEAQFTPRAIMMRDRRVETDQATPRRERTRIAARAVAAADMPTVRDPEVGSEQALAGEAVAVILSRAADLERDIDPEAKVAVDLILDHARETGEQLMAVLSRGRSEPIRRINSDLGEVLDLIMLMQLEKGHAPADDALTLLLQLRRELETLRAV